MMTFHCCVTASPFHICSLTSVLEHLHVLCVDVCVPLYVRISLFINPFQYNSSSSCPHSLHFAPLAQLSFPSHLINSHSVSLPCHCHLVLLTRSDSTIGRNPIRAIAHSSLSSAVTIHNSKQVMSQGLLYSY